MKFTSSLLSFPRFFFLIVYRLMASILNTSHIRRCSPYHPHLPFFVVLSLCLFLAPCSSTEALSSNTSSTHSPTSLDQSQHEESIKTSLSSSRRSLSSHHKKTSDDSHVIHSSSTKRATTSSRFHHDSIVHSSNRSGHVGLFAWLYHKWDQDEAAR